MLKNRTDVNGDFVIFAGLFLMAIFVCGAGVGGVLPALVAVYFMLVATNAIARGENKARRKARQRTYKQ